MLIQALSGVGFGGYELMEGRLVALAHAEIVAALGGGATLAGLAVGDFGGVVFVEEEDVEDD